jgi:putative endonuclease
MSTFVVYVLQSQYDGKRYIGLTSNLDSRINNHNQGKVFSTRGRRPFKLLYTESYSSRIEARNREKYFKSGAGRRFLNKVLGINKGNEQAGGKSLQAYQVPMNNIDPQLDSSRIIKILVPIKLGEKSYYKCRETLRFAQGDNLVTL